VSDGAHLRRIDTRDRRLQDIHALVHLAPVRVRSAPTVQISPGTDQRQDSISQRNHRPSLSIIGSGARQ
jgi:hypothetical protein